MPISSEFECVEVAQRKVRPAGSHPLSPATDTEERLVLAACDTAEDQFELDEGLECVVLRLVDPELHGSIRYGKRYRVTIEEVRAKRKPAEVVKPPPTTAPEPLEE